MLRITEDDFSEGRYDLLFEITLHLLHHERVEVAEVEGRYAEQTLRWSAPFSFPADVAGGQIKVPGPYEAAEVLYHLGAIESTDYDVRCRSCGYLDPAPGIGGYDDKPDDLKVTCSRCQTTDRLGAMRGIAPAATPTTRARRKLIEATHSE